MAASAVIEFIRFMILLFKLLNIKNGRKIQVENSTVQITFVLILYL